MQNQINIILFLPDGGGIYKLASSTVMPDIQTLAPKWPPPKYRTFWPTLAPILPNHALMTPQSVDPTVPPLITTPKPISNSKSDGGKQTITTVLMESSDTIDNVNTSTSSSSSSSSSTFLTHETLDTSSNIAIGKPVHTDEISKGARSELSQTISIQVPEKSRETIHASSSDHMTLNIATGVSENFKKEYISKTTNQKSEIQEKASVIKDNESTAKTDVRYPVDAQSQSAIAIPNTAPTVSSGIKYNVTDRELKQMINKEIMSVNSRSNLNQVPEFARADGGQFDSNITEPFVLTNITESRQDELTTDIQLTSGRTSSQIDLKDNFVLPDNQGPDLSRGIKFIEKIKITEQNVFDSSFNSSNIIDTAVNQTVSETSVAGFDNALANTTNLAEDVQSFATDHRNYTEVKSSDIFDAHNTSNSITVTNTSGRTSDTIDSGVSKEGHLIIEGIVPPQESVNAINVGSTVTVFSDQRETSGRVFLDTNLISPATLPSSPSDFVTIKTINDDSSHRSSIDLSYHQRTMSTTMPPIIPFQQEEDVLQANISFISDSILQGITSRPKGNLDSDLNENNQTNMHTNSHNSTMKLESDGKTSTDNTKSQEVAIPYGIPVDPVESRPVVTSTANDSTYSLTDNSFNDTFILNSNVQDDTLLSKETIKMSSKTNIVLKSDRSTDTSIIFNSNVSESAVIGQSDSETSKGQIVMLPAIEVKSEMTAVDSSLQRDEIVSSNTSQHTIDNTLIKSSASQNSGIALPDIEVATNIDNGRQLNIGSPSGTRGTVGKSNDKLSVGTMSSTGNTRSDMFANDEFRLEKAVVDNSQSKSVSKRELDNVNNQAIPISPDVLNSVVKSQSELYTDTHETSTVTSSHMMSNAANNLVGQTSNTDLETVTSKTTALTSGNGNGADTSGSVATNVAEKYTKNQSSSESLVASSSVVKTTQSESASLGLVTDVNIGNIDTISEQNSGTMIKAIDINKPHTENKAQVFDASSKVTSDSISMITHSSSISDNSMPVIPTNVLFGNNESVIASNNIGVVDSMGNDTADMNLTLANSIFNKDSNSSDQLVKATVDNSMNRNASTLYLSGSTLNIDTNKKTDFNFSISTDALFVDVNKTSSDQLMTFDAGMMDQIQQQQTTTRGPSGGLVENLAVMSIVGGELGEGLGEAVGMGQLGGEMGEGLSEGLIEGSLIAAAAGDSSNNVSMTTTGLDTPYSDTALDQYRNISMYNSSIINDMISLYNDSDYSISNFTDLTFDGNKNTHIILLQNETIALSENNSFIDNEAQNISEILNQLDMSTNHDSKMIVTRNMEMSNSSSLFDLNRTVSNIRNEVTGYSVLSESSARKNGAKTDTKQIVNKYGVISSDIDNITDFLKNDTTKLNEPKKQIKLAYDKKMGIAKFSFQKETSRQFDNYNSTNRFNDSTYDELTNQTSVLLSNVEAPDTKVTNLREIRNAPLVSGNDVQQTETIMYDDVSQVVSLAANIKTRNDNSTTERTINKDTSAIVVELAINVKTRTEKSTTESPINNDTSINLVELASNVKKRNQKSSTESPINKDTFTMAQMALLTTNGDVKGNELNNSKAVDISQNFTNSEQNVKLLDTVAIQTTSSSIPDITSSVRLKTDKDIEKIARATTELEFLNRMEKMLRFLSKYIDSVHYYFYGIPTPVNDYSTTTETPAINGSDLSATIIYESKEPIVQSIQLDNTNNASDVQNDSTMQNKILNGTRKDFANVQDKSKQQFVTEKTVSKGQMTRPEKDSSGIHSTTMTKSKYDATTELKAKKNVLGQDIVQDNSNQQFSSVDRKTVKELKVETSVSQKINEEQNKKTLDNSILIPKNTNEVDIVINRNTPEVQVTFKSSAKANISVEEVKSSIRDVLPIESSFMYNDSIDMANTDLLESRKTLDQTLPTPAALPENDTMFIEQDTNGTVIAYLPSNMTVSSTYDTTTEIPRAVELLTTKITETTTDIPREIELFSTKITETTTEIPRELELFTTKITETTTDIPREIEMLTTKIAETTTEIPKEIELLTKKITETTTKTVDFVSPEVNTTSHNNVTGSIYNNTRNDINDTSVSLRTDNIAVSESIKLIKRPTIPVFSLKETKSTGTQTLMSGSKTGSGRKLITDYITEPEMNATETITGANIAYNTTTEYSTDISLSPTTSTIVIETMDVPTISSLHPSKRIEIVAKTNYVEPILSIGKPFVNIVQPEIKPPSWLYDVDTKPAPLARAQPNNVMRGRI